VPRGALAHIGGKTNAICDRGAKYEPGFFRAMIFFQLLVAGDWLLATATDDQQPATSNQQPATSNQRPATSN
jgi:hypothetical protein